MLNRKNEGVAPRRTVAFDLDLPQPHVSYHRIYDQKDKYELVLLKWTTMIWKRYLIKRVCIN